MKFYKYQGAGNDFLIADNRDGSIVLSTGQIAALCDRRYGVGADGLMLLESPGTTHHDGVQWRCAARLVRLLQNGQGGRRIGAPTIMFCRIVETLL